MTEFKKQASGPDVATIFDNENQVVEVTRRDDGQFDLTIHRVAEDSDTWDDMTAVLRPGHFIELGDVPFVGAPGPDEASLGAWNPDMLATALERELYGAVAYWETYIADDTPHQEPYEQARRLRIAKVATRLALRKARETHG